MKIVGSVLSAVLFSVLQPTVILQAQQKPEDLAQKSAEAWLALTDSGQYAESWEQVSAGFKSAVSKDKWVGMVSSARDPLGALQSRKVASAKYVKNPSNTPEGEYVILRYDTNFEKLSSTIETVSMTLDNDGQWRARRLFNQTAFPMNPGNPQFGGGV